MLKNVEEFGKYIVIAGFKNVKIDSREALASIRKEKQPQTEIQFFNAKLIATWQHIYFGVLNALTAFRNGENISKSLAVETMLYVSAQRQIRKAVELIGVKPSALDVAVVVIGDKPEIVKSTLKVVAKRVDGQLDNSILELSKEKRTSIQKVFEISDVELETAKEKTDADKALIDLVIERMALLSTRR